MNEFLFIDLSTRSRIQQAENQRLVRSHTTKVARRVQRSQRSQRGKEVALEDESNNALDSTTTGQTAVDSAKALDSEQTRALALYFRKSTRGPNVARLSQKPAIESTINAIQTYKGKVSPYCHELLGFYASNIWPNFLPPEGDEPPPLSIEWFGLVQTHPAVFHAACYGAATHLDMIHSKLFYTVTPEVRMHKIMAIHLINKELTKGKDVPEALILAIMTLLREASDTMEDQRASEQSEAESGVKEIPFRPPPFLMQW
jgi:hypothetical protein